MTSTRSGLMAVLCALLLLGCPDRSIQDDDDAGDENTGSDDDDTTGSDDDDSGDSCVDEDGDGYGSTGSDDCPQALVDCDDEDAGIHPDADEECNEVDDNCDGVIDEGFDQDGDGIADCVDDCPVYADPDAPAGGSGRFDDPCTTVAEAIAALPEGCLTIRLFPGTFYELVDYGGLDLDIASLEGPEITVIEAPAGGSVITVASGETTASSLTGVTVRGGTGTLGYPGTDPTLAYGGGLFVYGASPSIVGCILEDNEVDTGYGGGAFLYEYGGEFSHNLVRANVAYKDDEAPGGGGGLRAELSSGTFVHNTFEGNQSVGESADGGAIEIFYGDPWVAHNLFVGNTATATGGAIRTGYSTTTILNNRFVDNEPDAVQISYDDAGALTHNTFVGNHPATLTTRTCCGYSGPGPTCSVTHNILAESGEAAVNVEGSLSLSAFAYNDVWGAGVAPYSGMDDPTGTEGNLSVDPQLLDTTAPDPATWDLHLAAASPLVDAGDPTSFDPDGSTGDMGAYGGSAAGEWDLDGDGYPQWWQPGPYDPVAYPGSGWDCDDGDPTVFPGQGC